MDATSKDLRASPLDWAVPFWGGRNSEGDEGVAGDNALVAFLDDSRTLARLDFNDFYTSKISPWCESMIVRIDAFFNHAEGEKRCMWYANPFLL